MRLSETCPQETNLLEPLSDNSDFAFATERLLKTILAGPQKALAMHGPASFEFRVASKQAQKSILGTGIQPHVTRLGIISDFLLDQNSPLHQQLNFDE